MTQLSTHFDGCIFSQTDDIKTKMESQRKTLESNKKEINKAQAVGVATITVATNGMATNVSTIILFACKCCIISNILVIFAFQCST